VQSLPNATAYQLARAFAFFFDLINLAETNHRKRRRKSSRSLYAAPTTITRVDHIHRKALPRYYSALRASRQTLSCSIWTLAVSRIFTISLRIEAGNAAYYLYIPFLMATPVQPDEEPSGLCLTTRPKHSTVKTTRF